MLSCSLGILHYLPLNTGRDNKATAADSQEGFNQRQDNIGQEHRSEEICQQVTMGLP